MMLVKLILERKMSIHKRYFKLGSEYSGEKCMRVELDAEIKMEFQSVFGQSRN
jgi:hypothetical protein